MDNDLEANRKRRSSQHSFSRQSRSLLFVVVIFSGKLSQWFSVAEDSASIFPEYRLIVKFAFLVRLFSLQETN